jgi:predicted GNAT superfamily acetyltransferase
LHYSVAISELRSLIHRNTAREIFDTIWSTYAGTEITSNLLQAMVHSGSYLSGAFIDNKIVGAAFAFPATNGGLHLHSHMTAVLPCYSRPRRE